MQENTPILISSKPLKPEFKQFQKIAITSENFTLGRGLDNSVVIPYIAISRNHCKFQKIKENDWIIEDCSSFGVIVNENKLGKGTKRKLLHKDVIKLDPVQEFVYEFNKHMSEMSESPRKRMKLNESLSKNIINNVKLKFEESQNIEIQHIEEKIQSAKQMQTTSLILKQQLQLKMDRKIKQLENEFASQIENLKGENNEVEHQKVLLIKQRDAQLTSVKQEMEEKIKELMDQIKKHNDTESELLKENNLLRDKLLKEREEFLSELNRESSSKQEMYDKLEAKMRELEEIRLKDKRQLEEMLQQETEKLRLAKEKELKELEEQKKLRERELEQELNDIKNILEVQVRHTEEQKQKAEQLLNEQLEQMKKLNKEEKVKMVQLVQEREEIQNKLNEAQNNAEKSLEALRMRVTERETELAALAAERIQKQAEQSGQVISSLQEQLEKVQCQLKSVETEKNALLKNHGLTEGESSTKQNTLAEVGELMENELQCSICAELFIAATTLNCSHTFCKYCITKWKHKKKDCPICRAPITSECKSLVLDSFIEKMILNLTEEMKQKRLELLKSREELESSLTYRRPESSKSPNQETNYRSENSEYDDDDSDYSNISYITSESEEQSTEETIYEDDDYLYFEYGSPSDTDSGSHNDSNESTSSTAIIISDSRTSPHQSNTRGRRHVPGVVGAYYGGYGRCYRCGARGHWAPGCPYR